MRYFLWCYYRWFITSLALEKRKKECDIFKFILVQDFCPLNIKITQVPDEFRLKTLHITLEKYDYLDSYHFRRI